MGSPVDDTAPAHLSVPGSFIAALAGSAPTELLVADLLVAAAPQLPFAWLAVALPVRGTADLRLVPGPGLPAELVPLLRDALAPLAEARSDPGSGRSGPVPSLPGVRSSLVRATASARTGGSARIWLGAPSRDGPPRLDANARARVDELAAMVGAILVRSDHHGLLRWAERLVRAGGFFSLLAAGGALEPVLDVLCRSFEGLNPAHWAIVTWLGEEGGRVYAPTVAPALREAMEASARAALGTDGPRRGQRQLYARLAGTIASLGGRLAFAHRVRSASGETAATILLLDAAPARPRPRLGARERSILRAASNCVALAIESERLRRQRTDGDARYESLLHVASRVVWLLDPAGTLRHARGWQELTGHAVPEPLEGWLGAFHPDDRAAMRRALAAFARADSAVDERALECRVGGADGRYHHLAFRMAARRGPAGDLAEILAAASDVSYEREAERALEGLVEARERYASVLAHELRTPLATMTAALELLRPAVPPEPLAQEALAVLAQSLGNQARLIQNVLADAQLGGDGGELALRPFDMADLLEALAPSLALQARQKGLTLEVRPSPAGRHWLTADRERVVRLVNNLVTNAVRYTPAGGHVWLAIERAGDRLCLTVADDGIGIPAQVLPRIFEPYYRGEGQRSGDAGLGLGLHLVRELARAHGGEVEATSGGPGKGTTFRVYLPVQGVSPSQRLLATPLAPLAPLAAPKAGSRASARPILIVEDDYGLREMLVALLAREGFTARTARTAAEALRRAASGPSVAAVICDLGLPDLSGLELLPQLRALPGCARLPALALSGWGAPADIERARAAGFDRHVVKPADIAVVTAWLSAVTAVAQPQAPPAEALRQGTGTA